MIILKNQRPDHHGAEDAAFWVTVRPLLRMLSWIRALRPRRCSGRPAPGLPGDPASGRRLHVEEIGLTSAEGAEAELENKRFIESLGG